MRLILLMCLAGSFLHSVATKKRRSCLPSSLFKRNAQKKDHYPHITAAWRGDEVGLQNVYKTMGTDLSKDQYGNHTLSAAASHHKNTILRMALKHEKKRLDDPGHLHYTALHWSCLTHNNEGVGMLLEAGACTEIKGFENQTPLHVACNERNPAATHLLLKHGSDIEVEDVYYNTPLIYAIRKELDLEIIASLMNKSTATSKALKEALHRNCPEVVALLLNYSAELPAGEKLYPSPFYLDSKEGLNKWIDIQNLMHAAFPISEKYSAANADS